LCLGLARLFVSTLGVKAFSRQPDDPAQELDGNHEAASEPFK
jgi:hypothetical protein